MIGRPLIRLDSVDSTQRVAFGLAERGAREGTTVLAGYQTGGRGRAGRAWSVPAGEALLFSVLLRPRLESARLALLSILVGEAITAVFQDQLGLAPAIKWPNDVLVGGRKVSGILIQTRQLPGSPSLIVVMGIGVNVSSARDCLPDGATSLAAETGGAVDPEHLFRALLASIEGRYASLLEGRTSEVISRVNERLWLKDQHVRVEDAGRVISGRLLGVARDGALLLDTPAGRRRIVSGEMTRGPRPERP